MPEYLLAHLAIPFFAGVVVLAIVVASGRDRINWDAANDAALDMTILSIGATGSLLLNQAARALALYGMLSVLANLLLSCILAYRKRWKPDADREPTFGNMLPDLIMGALALCLTAGLFVVGYGYGHEGGVK